MTTTALSEVLAEMRAEECKDRAQLSSHVRVWADRIESALASAEPVAYEERMRPAWDERAPWTPWERCSRESYENFASKPNPWISNDWEIQHRSLYTHAQPAAKVETPGYKLSDEQIATLLSEGLKPEEIGGTAEVQHAREAAGRADAVPDGYALVPAIPTEAMTDAYWRAVVLPDNARLSDRPKAVARWQAMLSAAPLPQHPPATRVQVVTLFGHPKRNLYHRPQGLSETVGGFDLRSREIGAAIEPFGVVNQQLTAGDVVSPAHAADIDPWATLIVLCEALGIDIQEARSVPGKPSDVILEAARKKFSEPAHAGAGAEALTHEVSRWCSGDDAWSNWQPCTAEKAAEYAKDDLVKFRRLTGGDHA